MQLENLQGTLLKGYKLEERIGNGGFGAVYRAKQPTIGREVAVKIILPGFANNPDFIRRFESEAHLIARLEHPHITPLHDFWRDPSGAYLVMRYLRGGSVRDSLQHGGYELKAVSLLLDQIASALDFAHRNEVIHRDIKPGNLLLDEDGNAYLADFGIAKDLTGVTGEKTAADSVVGSLDYISPEQARSEPVTPRTDIYSLGVTLYEMITGEHPFKDVSTVERLYKHINDPLPLIDTLDSDVATTINQVIQKATAKDPDKRYADVLALAVAFREGIGMGSTRDGALVEQLTLREQEILALIVKGMSNREIAEELVVTLSTVKWHLNQLYKKMGVRSRVQAIVRARELNLIVTGDTSGDLSALVDVPADISLPEPENPYKGLHAFQTTDSRDFFGRDDLTAKLVDRMQENDAYQRFLAIIGPSGSGKSSLVKAGLIPALWKGAIPGSEKWFVVDMIPGTHPLDKLEVALMRVAAQQTSNLHEQLQRDERGLLRVADLILPGDDTELVIVVDQFEEVFTLVNDEAARQHFLDLLRVAVSDVRSRVRVIVTLRADYYDRPLHYPEFGDLVRTRMETVLPLSAKGLERAVRGPAERVGVAFEQGLVEQIVSAMNYQSGALPLLQYALTELFDRREGRLLTNAAYQQIGGAVGALANRADEIYLSMTEPTQALAHQMFMRLVTLGEGAEDTRRRANHAELMSLTGDPDLMEEIIDTFAAYRLLSLDNDPETRQPTVEVAHEAILREWERLRGWLNESREDIRQEQAVARAASEWREHGEDASYLIRGARLEQVEKWHAASSLILTPLEQTFIQKSLNQRELEHKAELKRQAREERLEKRSRSFLRGLVAVFLVATLVSAGLALLANAERGRTEDALRESDLNFQLSESRRLAGAATLLLPNTNQDAEVAALLALNALRTDYSVEADIALTQALELLYTERRIAPVDGVPFRSIGLSADESTMVTGDSEGWVRFWNARSFQPEGSMPVQEGSIEGVVYTPDGTQLVTLVRTSGDSGFVRLWDLATQSVIREEAMENGHPSFAAFTADGDTLILTEESQTQNAVTIHVWDRHDWESINIIENVRGLVADQNLNAADPVDLSPNGTDIVYFDAGWQVVIQPWQDDESMTLLSNIPTSLFFKMLAYSPDEELLAVASEQGVMVFEVTTGEIIREFPEPIGDAIERIAFTPDSQGLLITGTSNLYLIDIATGEILRRFSGGSRHVTPLFFEDSRHFVAISDDGIRLWNADLDNQAENIAVEGFFPKPSNDGSILLSANADLMIYDAATGEVLQTLPNDIQAVWMALSPDTRFAFVGVDWDPGVLRLWDWQAGELVWEVNTDYGVSESQFSPDGRYIVTPCNDGVIRLWSALDGSLVREFRAESAADWIANFSADGRLIVGGGTGRTAYIWETETGELLHEFTVTNDPSAWLLTAFFSPDSRLLSTVTTDNRLQIWDIASETSIYNTTTFGSSSRFSHDGLYLGYATENNQIIMLDVQTLQVARRIFSSHPGSRRTWFSPDDRYFFVGHSDQSFSRFIVSLDDVVAEACARLTRDFSLAERQRYYVEDAIQTCQPPS